MLFYRWFSRERLICFFSNKSCENTEDWDFLYILSYFFSLRLSFSRLFTVLSKHFWYTSNLRSVILSSADLKSSLVFFVLRSSLINPRLRIAKANLGELRFSLRYCKLKDLLNLLYYCTPFISLPPLLNLQTFKFKFYNIYLLCRELTLYEI